jgi:electron transport complex protein RnfG
MHDNIKTGLVLMIIAIISATLLSIVYMIVKAPIEQSELNAKLKAIEQVLTNDETGELLINSDNLPENKETLNKYFWNPENYQSENNIIYKSDNGKGWIYDDIYRFDGLNNETIYVLTGGSIGYGGEVKTIAAYVDNENKIYLNAIRVIEYASETPGLGAKISEINIQERFYPILSEGLEVGVKVNKDAGVQSTDDYEFMIERREKEGIVQTSDVMTGATITPRAVASTLNSMYEFLMKVGENNE